jgi:hypothetical protein
VKAWLIFAAEERLFTSVLFPPLQSPWVPVTQGSLLSRIITLSGLSELLRVVFHVLPDCGCGAKGCSSDSSVEHWVQGEDSLCLCGGDWWVVLLGDISIGEWKGESFRRQHDFHWFG